MRSLVSYDDIASQIPSEKSSSTQMPYGSPPKKKRKHNNRQGQRGNHRDSYRGEQYEAGEYEFHATTKSKRRNYGIKEESRQLTYEEIWDDSVLIQAWDAAVEEYEVLNGPDKKWKSEPIKKSPLWYNIPPEKKEEPDSSSGDEEAAQQEDPENSRPLNFDTFVPRHDPSLTRGEPSIGPSVGAMPNGIFPPPPIPVGGVSTEDAFQNAMGAWYWAGYWTGVYHVSISLHLRSPCH
ncbi:hypothetical protein BU17DRAFT_58419 [Hysterangium stoloniferum]|nr:hypothetical protein BU17DRAFT_58419 [Hysterangium stoloniferum]